jgi:hypothetical protein
MALSSSLAPDKLIEKHVLGIVHSIDYKTY